MSLNATRRARQVARICLLAAGLVTGAGADEALPVLRINGLALAVTRLAGPDAATRVASLESQWRALGDPVLPWQQQGDWRVLAHRSGRWSEVLQVRGRGAATEAYLSRLDVQRAPAPIAVLPLPAGCKARSTVESGAAGDAAIQVTGSCSEGSAGARSAWTAALIASGWQGGVQADGNLYRFRRRRDELVVVFLAPAAAHAAEARAFTALQRPIAREDGP